MSWVLRGATLFVVAGGISFSPQGVKEVTNWARSLKIFSAPPARASNSIDQLVEAGYKDCTDLTGYKGVGTLYVCWYLRQDNSWTPSFFYYKRNTKGSPKTSSFRLVEKFSTKKFHFSEGKEVESLYRSPYWMKNWNNVDLIPERHCRLPETKKREHLVTCTHPTSREETRVY